ncbi:DUF4827 domain-containing protein [Marseilla massiliensis]|uniref:DUF4827 domain-containing protein n=1 Tax=Marseilla massiliensis TaxID=1841864 RepID=A0A939B874_9BACT|nr:DUF4827 domain-containing protein [Marseilla massiliensis]MBM6674501.1 DUF4827 domain-containing protein [Marseilla massiliensis]
MKKLAFAFITMLALVILASCDDTETYAEQRDRENSAISQFIRDSSITVITESEFRENGYKTDVSNNEYVLMQNSGVYMQIVREGCGEPIQDGETTTVLCRFTERNILTDSIQLTNDILAFASIPEKMSVTNTNGSFTASFLTESSLMYTFYGSTSVPTGWLVPFPYIKVGRQTSPDEEIAKVNLIVPSTQGHKYASSGVYPCFYTITYQRGR